MLRLSQYFIKVYTPVPKPEPNPGPSSLLSPYMIVV